MNKKKIILLIILFFTLIASVIYAGTWIETDYRIRFDFPRAWSKRAVKKNDKLIITLSKYHRAFIILEAIQIKRPFNLDRFIEDDLDEYLATYDSVEVEKELVVRGKIPSMSGQSIYIVLSYEANGQSISDRLLYIRNGSFYYVFRFRSFRGEYAIYKSSFQVVVDSIKISQISRPGQVRNDSKFYMFTDDFYINDEYSIKPTLRKPKPKPQPVEVPKEEIRSEEEEEIRRGR